MQKSRYVAPLGMILLTLAGPFCLSSNASRGSLDDLRGPWLSEVSQGRYTSYEAIAKASSTNQLREMLLRGIGKYHSKESMDLLVTQHLASVSIDQTTQFRNFAAPGVLAAADNPLNASVTPQTVTITEKAIDLLVSNTMSAFVAKTDQVRVNTMLTTYLLPEDVELQGTNLNLRGALNQIGKAAACGWAVRCAYEPKRGYYVELEMAKLPRRKEIPWVQPVEGKLSTNDPVGLLAIARTGNPNERRLAEIALMGYVGEEKYLKQIQELALEILRGHDIQQRQDVAGQLPFIFKFPYGEPALSVEKRFPDRTNDIARIRGLTSIKYRDLLRLLKTGDPLEKGLACERFTDQILNSSQTTSAQMKEVWAILVSHLEDEDEFVRWESGAAIKEINSLSDPFDDARHAHCQRRRVDFLSSEHYAVCEWYSADPFVWSN